MSITLAAGSSAASYAPIGILLVLTIASAVAIILLSHFVNPRRKGVVKDSPYESGMPVIGDARRRFNVKFYIVAMLFLLFDVEIVFLWPWAPLFYRAATNPDHPAVATMVGQGFGKGFLLAEVGLFLAILLVGYLYAWRKGVFRWS
jgi:NADH-quinone oxidoreductase subunit A